MADDKPAEETASSENAEDALSEPDVEHRSLGSDFQGFLPREVSEKKKPKKKQPRRHLSHVGNTKSCDACVSNYWRIPKPGSVKKKTGTLPQAF